MFALFFLILMSSDARSEVACDIRSLHRNCKFFEAYPEKIVLDDGTFFTNPLSLHRQNQKAKDEHGKKEQEKLIFQARVLDALRGIPANVMSGLFLMKLQNSIGDDYNLFNWANGNLDLQLIKEMKIPVPWPADDPKAEFKTIGPDEYYGYLNQLPAGELSKLKALILEVGDPVLKNKKKLEAANAVSKERRDRIREIFDFARKEILGEILGNRSYQSLTPAEKNLYARLETIEYKDGACHEADFAGYNPHLHAFTVCGGFANNPDSQLAAVVAHELAHSIGPCVSRFPMIEINKKAEELKDHNNLPKEISGLQDVSRLTFFLENALAEKVKYSSVYDLNIAAQPQTLQGVADAKYMNIISPGIKPEDYPFSSSVSCLIEDAGIKAVTEEGIKLTVESYLRNQNLTPGGVPKLVEKLSQQLREFKECGADITGQTQIEEGHADLWGAKVQGRWMKAHPPKNEIEKLAAFSIHLKREPGCDATDAKLNPQIGEITALAKTAKDEDEHPTPIKRADAIYLKDHHIRQIFGCDPLKRTCSDYFSLEGRKTSKAKPVKKERAK